MKFFDTGYGIIEKCKNHFLTGFTGSLGLLTAHMPEACGQGIQSRAVRGPPPPSPTGDWFLPGGLQARHEKILSILFILSHSLLPLRIFTITENPHDSSRSRKSSTLSKVHELSMLPDRIFPGTFEGQMDSSPGRLLTHEKEVAYVSGALAEKKKCSGLY